MPARSRTAPGWEACLRDETNGILEPTAEQTMGRNPFPLERAETGLRKTSVTRELPVGDAGHAPSAFARPWLKDVRTTLLFTMSMPAKMAGGKSENRSQPPEFLAASVLSSGF